MADAGSIPVASPIKRKLIPWDGLVVLDHDATYRHDLIYSDDVSPYKAAVGREVQFARLTKCASESFFQLFWRTKMKKMMMVFASALAVASASALAADEPAQAQDQANPQSQEQAKPAAQDQTNPAAKDQAAPGAQDPAAPAGSDQGKSDQKEKS